MVSSEFGRTPKINKDAGRDHYPKVFSVMLAGGGIKGGTIYGSVQRDRIGAGVRSGRRLPTWRPRCITSWASWPTRN